MTFTKQVYIALMFLITMVALSGCKNDDAEKNKEQEAQHLEALKKASQKILPEPFRNAWLGISEEALVKARTNAKFHPEKGDPYERKWYIDFDKSGVQIRYGVDRETKRVVAIQISSKLPTWRAFSEHAALLIEKYGTDYELYVCPKTDPRFKMTRLLWPRQPVSFMEAILEAENAVSVTMVISTLEDARDAIERQRCLIIDKEAYLQTWIQENLEKEQPTQSKLPGEPHVH